MPRIAPPTPAPLPRPATASTAAALADRLGLAAVARTSVRRLSGGQRQRLALAVALCSDPDLLFLDEPSAGLDPHGRRDAWDLVRERRDAGSAVVLTTHLLAEAEELADIVHVMVGGRIVASGSPADLIARHAGSDTIRLTFQRRLAPAEQAGLAARLAPCRLESASDGYVVRGMTTTTAATSRTAITRAIATWCDEQQLPLLSLRAGGGTLEQAYLALTDAAAERPA